MPASTAKAPANPFGALQKIRTVQPSSRESQDEAPRRGRPIKTDAKSRDPEWRAWTGYLKKNTVTEAEYRLKLAGNGRSVSDLLEELLSEWVASQGKS